MHEVLVNRLGGLSLPRKSVVRLTDRPDMTLDVYRGRKTTIQLTYNLSKSESLLVSRKNIKLAHPHLKINSENIKEVSHHKHLGIFLSSDGSWHRHIEYILTKAWQRLYIM